MNKEALLAGLMFGDGGSSGGGSTTTIYDGNVTIVDQPVTVNISSDIDPATWTVTFDGHKIEYDGEFYYEDEDTGISYYLGYDGDDWHAEVYNLNDDEYAPGTYGLNIVAPSSVIEITSNGVADVSEYTAALVNVPASAVVSGTKQITANGNFDVTDYAAVNVNVGSSLSTKRIIVEFTSQSSGEARISNVVESGQLLVRGKTLSSSGTYNLDVLTMITPSGSIDNYAAVIFPNNPATDYLEVTVGSGMSKTGTGDKGVIVIFGPAIIPTITIKARTT